MFLFGIFLIAHIPDQLRNYGGGGGTNNHQISSEKDRKKLFSVRANFLPFVSLSFGNQFKTKPIPYFWLHHCPWIVNYNGYKLKVKKFHLHDGINFLNFKYFYSSTYLFALKTFSTVFTRALQVFLE